MQHSDTSQIRRAAIRLHLSASLLLALALASACGVREEGGGGGDTGTPGGASIGSNADLEYRQAPASCQFDDMKSWIHAGMLDYYLFYDQVDRNVNLVAYDSLDTLITDLRVSPNDTFSYITDEQSHTDRFTEGEATGFGWLLSRTVNDDVYFKLIEPGSPLAAAGVQRSDRLVSVNGIPTLDFFQQASTAREAILSSEDRPVTADFTIETPLGMTRTLSATKARYPIQTVLDTKVIDHAGVRTGYLHFYQFLNTSTEELATAFAGLAAQDISELVLDLRYNFGGRVMIANELASYIVGRGKTDQAFAVYQPNDRYSEYASTIRFLNQLNALELSRVFILQTGDTCSASELVINGLRPFMDVVTVGDTSCGKPYATIPNTACGKVMNALELEAVNAAGSGGFYDGIAADCPVAENIGQALGSESENLLASALEFIDSGQCSAGTASARTVPASEALQATRQATRQAPLPAILRPAWFGTSTF